MSRVALRKRHLLDPPAEVYDLVINLGKGRKRAEGMRRRIEEACAEILAERESRTQIKMRVSLAGGGIGDIEREIYLSDLRQVFEEFFSMLRTKTTLEQRSSAWDRVDTARVKHENAIEGYD